MTARKIKVSTIETPQIIEPPTLTVTPNQGGNAVFASWRFLYHVLGARKDRFEISDDGVTVVGLTFPTMYNTEQIINDVYRRGDDVVNPKLALFPGYYFLSGFDPIPYTGSDEMTADLTKFFHNAPSSVDGRSPKYAKDAIANYKAVAGFAVPRGRPRKNVTIRIGELNEEALRELPAEEIESLREVLAHMAPETA